MGEAKDIIQGSPSKKTKKSKASKPFNEYGVLDTLSELTDNLDRAIEVKEDDLLAEGTSVEAENRLKIGRLRASKALLMQAQALLEDYDKSPDQ